MPDGTTKDARSGIQVIARAAAVMRALKDAPTGMSLAQIADKIDLPRSTVQRIVGALQEERLVIAPAKGGGIRLGPELHALGIAARFNIVEQARPYLKKLASITGETVDLSVLRNGRMIFLDQIVGLHRLRTISSVGETFPLTTTANGRACLALLPRPQALDLARAEWTQQGVTGYSDAFAKTLNNTQQAGLAFDEDEHTDGISAIGIAFKDAAGDLYSISVPIPTSRYVKKRQSVVKVLLETQSELATALDR